MTSGVVADAVRLALVSRLVDIRTTAPDFRVTPAIRALALAAGVAAAALLGSAVVLLHQLGPALLRMLGSTTDALPAVVRLLGLAGAVHLLCAVSGRGARELASPSDGRILDHAGRSRGRILVLREVLPATVTAASFLAAAVGTVLLGRSWGTAWGAVLPSLGLATALLVAATLLRIALVARLARGWAPATGRRTVLAVGGCLVGGALLGAPAVQLLAGQRTLEESASSAVRWLWSDASSAPLWLTALVLVVLAGVLAVGIPRRGWEDGFADRAPVTTMPRRAGRLPGRPWWVVAALPVTSLRERARSDASEAVAGWRMSVFAGAFGIGLAVAGRTGLALPRELAEGLLFGAPIAAAAGIYGVASMAAHGRVGRALAGSALSGARLSTATAVASLWSTALASWAVLPLTWAFSDLTASRVLVTWAAGLVLAPSVFHVPDCLLPARARTTSPLRLRQSSPAALVTALLGTLGAAAWWWATTRGVPGGVALLVVAASALLEIVIVRPRNGGIS